MRNAGVCRFALGVLQEVGECGASRAFNKHLARAAHITEDAVKFHLKNIYRKLGVHSRSEALAVLDANNSPAIR
jgi:DNA-binding NarL/FixJ family response regulator